MDESKEVKVAIIPPLQQIDKPIVQNGVSHKDQSNHLQKSTWSWKDKLKLSKQIWSSSNFESAVDISSNGKNYGHYRYGFYMSPA